MKKTIFTVLSLATMFAATAQQKEGKVIYSRTMQMRFQFNNGNEALQRAMPQSRTDKFELIYGNNKSIYQRIEEEISSDEAAGNGMQIRITAQGSNDIVYYDFTNASRTDQREIFDKKFIVADTIAKLNWKLTGQTKTILGYKTQQAVAQRVGIRMQTNMENGKIERREVVDTTNLTAWFAPDIAVPAGPDVPGQLPGLILALDLNNGRMVYEAVEVTPKANTAAIIPPTKGKKVTPAEFRTERDKMMAEMQKNNGGRGSRVIRMN